MGEKGGGEGVGGEKSKPHGARTVAVHAAVPVRASTATYDDDANEVVVGGGGQCASVSRQAGKRTTRYRSSHHRPRHSHAHFQSHFQSRCQSHAVTHYWSYHRCHAPDQGTSTTPARGSMTSTRGGESAVGSTVEAQLCVCMRAQWATLLTALPLRTVVRGWPPLGSVTATSWEPTTTPTSPDSETAGSGLPRGLLRPSDDPDAKPWSTNTRCGRRPLLVRHQVGAHSRDRTR